MAYSRMIRQNFFCEPKLAKYKVEQLYFLIGLVCTADDFGRFWYDASYLNRAVFQSDKGLSDENIQETLELFVKDGILCKYEIENTLYAHFPKWFDKGWFLKQRLDNPREFASPDCPFCRTEIISRKKRELSQTSKDKINQIKGKYKIKKQSIYSLLTKPQYVDRMYVKYDSVFDVDGYLDAVEHYIKGVVIHQQWDTEHKMGFEKQLAAFNEKIDNDFEPK